MKTTIFYFSGTGNCLKIARDLAAELGDAEVVSIASAVKDGANVPSGRIGFVFPVYAFSVPLIIGDFINKLQAPAGAYIFGVVTCASVASNVLDQLSAKLSKNDMRLSAGFVIKMPNNYTPFGEAFPLDKQKTMFTKEAERVKEIAAIIRENRACKIETSKLPLRIAGMMLSRLMKSVTRKEDKNFWTTDRCNGCGTCKKVCPVNDIKLVDRKPAWQHKCEQCFACLQWCPEEAIQYGKNTVGKKRYHHPAVSVKDFIQV